MNEIERGWEALRKRCCADPERAKRCVMVSREDFAAAIAAMRGDPDSAADAEITRLTEALRAAEEREKGLREALEPFAKCCEDWISDAADDEAWVRFRLLIKDYRRARQALAGAKP